MRFYWRQGKRIEGRPQTIWLIDRENGKCVMTVELSAFADDREQQYVMRHLKGYYWRYYLKVWSQQLKF